MPEKRASVFGDEWRRCLREHYKYVIRENDNATKTTLEPVLQQVGFRDDDLKRLYVEATMRADEMPDDFLPDMQQAAATVQDNKSFEIHPAECQCAACMDEVLEVGHDDDGQPLDEPDTPDEGEGNIFSVAQPASRDDEPDDEPKQLSMF